VFPREQPSPSDFHLWKEAIGCLCSGTTILPCTLGRHIRLPHLSVLWFTTTDCACLYHVCENTYDIYKKRRGLGTRPGTKYDRISAEGGLHPGTHFASVTMWSDICAVIHSCTPYPTPSIIPLTFLAMLGTFGNSSLWDNLSVNGDGEWIHAGIEMGTLCIAHDGSYMAEEATNLCSTGVVIFCQWSR
jgi:hypothetical protein